MTQSQYIINRKLSLVELGEKLGNISQACRNLGVSRQHYYDIKNVLEEEGIDGLLEKSRKKPRLANRVAPETEEAVMEYCLHEPTHGQIRVANELRKRGIHISTSGVRSVWQRNNATRKEDRLKRLEEWSKSNSNILTESQVKSLEDAKAQREAHGEIETHHPGFLLGQDTYYVGYIKGVGKIYQQTVIDTYSNVGFAKVYTEKNSLIAADMLNSKVLPYFDQEQMRVLRILTDRGSEYCGRQAEHAYQLFLHLADIEHSRTKAYSPQTNGSTEKLNQTIQEEFYKVAFRKTFYTSLEQLQEDLDSFMKRYNEDRTNQGKNCKGRTPKETLDDGYRLYKKYVINGSEVAVDKQNE